MVQARISPTVMKTLTVYGWGVGVDGVELPEDFGKCQIKQE